jgi:hypothetical protein
MEQIKLTNGSETFFISIARDDLGRAHGTDDRGSQYTRCHIGCEHEFAPAGATVWHDHDNTQGFWEVKP